MVRKPLHEVVCIEQCIGRSAVARHRDDLVNRAEAQPRICEPFSLEHAIRLPDVQQDPVSGDQISRVDGPPGAIRFTSGLSPTTSTRRSA